MTEHFFERPILSLIGKAHRQFSRRQLSLGHHSHIIVQDLLLLSVVPFDDDTRPILFNDRAGILGVRVP